MPLPLLESIKKRRTILRLTQSQLARQCDLSQSIIAKIEQGSVDPSYSTATKIFETLGRLEAKEADRSSRFLTLAAKDVMTKKIISVKPTDNVSMARELMTSANISQLPVIDDRNKSVGSITEAQMLTQPSDTIQVSEFMAAPFITVSPTTMLSTIRNILLGEPAVLVFDAKSNKIAGIITKFDLIRAIRGATS